MEHHQLGPYRVVSLLGKGGMGIVYRAVDTGSGQLVALKVARVEPTSRRALALEIQALSRLRHPGIVRILDHGEQDGEAWIATELVEGRPLRDQLVETHPSSGSGAPPTLVVEDIEDNTPVEQDRVRWEPDALRDALSVFRRLCTPLAWLHGEGLVHGDLKPENVIVRDDGSVVLVDFGLFRAFGSRGRDTLEVQQRVMGTAGYLSPEQRRIRVPDARSDLYAVGCMLYETVTGRAPFPRSDAVRRLPIQPPSELADIPAELDALILSLLQWEPRRRLGYASDLGEALETIGVAPDPTVGPTPRISLVRPAMVGRDDVLTVARDADAVVIVGDGGSGRTRLLAELGEGLDLPAIGADPRADGGVVPALLRAIAAVRPELLLEAAPVLVDLAPALRSVPGLADTPPPAVLPPGAALTRAAVVVVRTLAAARPLRVIVDDLDLADELAVRVIVDLVRRRTAGIRVAVSASPTSEIVARLAALGARIVTLAPFDDRTSTAMLEEQLGAEIVPEELATFVRTRAGGNPRFVSEYVRLLVDAGHLARRRGQWVVVARDGLAALPVPAGVEDLALQRLEALSDPARATAERAAVVDPAELPVDGALAELVTARILEVVGDRPRWTLPGLRDVVYARIPADRRAALHADAVRPDSPPEVRAFHLERAGQPAEARACWLRAGVEADEQSRWADGVQYLEAALALADGGADEVDARLRLSRMMRFRGRFDASIDVAVRVLGTPGLSSQHRFTAILLRAKGLSRRGSHDDGIAMLRTLADEARTAGQTRNEGQALEALAEARGDANDLPGSVESRRQALGCWEQCGTPTELAEARMSLANALQRQDRLGEAEALLDRAIPVLRGGNKPLAAAGAIATMALVRGSQGDWARSEVAAEEALALYRSLGVLQPEAQTLLILAEALRYLGRRDACFGRLAEAQGVVAELGQPRLEAMVDYNFALTELHFGGPDAVAALERCLPACTATGLTGPEANARLVLAGLHREAGRWERVELDRAAALAEQRGDLGLTFRVWCERGLLARHLGEDGRAELARARELLAAIGADPGTHLDTFDALCRAVEGPG